MRMSSDAIWFRDLMLVLPAQNWVFRNFLRRSAPLRKAAFREWFDPWYDFVDGAVYFVLLT